METAISGRAQSPCGRGTGFACARKLGLVIRSEPLRIFAALGFNCLMMPHCCVVKRSDLSGLSLFGGCNYCALVRPRRMTRKLSVQYPDAHLPPRATDAAKMLDD